MKLISNIDSLAKNHTGLLHFEHDGIPTFEECRQIIREVAYAKWCADKRLVVAGQKETLGIEEQYWLEAEDLLFGPQFDGDPYGYRIFVRDRSKPKVEDFYDHYDVVIVKPDGLQLLDQGDQP